MAWHSNPEVKHLQCCSCRYIHALCKNNRMSTCCKEASSRVRQDPWGLYMMARLPASAESCLAIGQSFHRHLHAQCPHCKTSLKHNVLILNMAKYNVLFKKIMHSISLTIPKMYQQYMKEAALESWRVHSKLTYYTIHVHKAMDYGCFFT